MYTTMGYKDKEKEREYQKAYYKKNAEQIALYNKKRNTENPNIWREYYEKNKEQFFEK